MEARHHHRNELMLALFKYLLSIGKSQALRYYREWTKALSRGAYMLVEETDIKLINKYTTHGIVRSTKQNRFWKESQ